MKTRTVLIAALMFLGLTAAAFAQATYSVGSIPVTTVIKTGLTEKSGDITFSQISGTSVTGTISISYGVPITVNAASIFIVAPTGSGYASATPATGFPAGTFVSTVTVNSVNNTSGILVLNVPGTVVAGTFTVSGVRVAIAGTTLSSLDANISTTGNAIVAGQTLVRVITSIADGIASVNSSTSGSVIGKINGITPNTAPSPLNPVIKIKEGFLNAFNDINPSTTFGTGLKIALSANPPKGITVTFPLSFTTDGLGGPTFVAFNSDPTLGALTTAPAIDSSSTDLNVYYKLTSTTDPTKAETATVSPTLTASNTNAPYAPFTESFSVSLWPNGTAFSSSGSVITTQALIPRYQELFVGPNTLFIITSSTTTLLVPFAQTVTAAGYNTGFAIANTTKDVGSVTGFASPTAQSGTITFTFFPQLPKGGSTLPASFTYLTSTNPAVGTGLDSTGKVPAGSTYTVLLSELLAAAGAPADFAGYIFIVTNFTDAHALYVVSNFSTFSQGSLALVITADRNGSTEALNN